MHNNSSLGRMLAIFRKYGAYQNNQLQDYLVLPLTALFSTAASVTSDLYGFVGNYSAAGMIPTPEK